MRHFTIIVPVYSESEGSNHYRGKTIKRLVQSIIDQTFVNWELILVDDGCPDGETPGVLDEYAITDPRIKVIHQTNQQRVIARNNGMRAAREDTWICWADSDDLYTRDYLWTVDRAINEFPDFKIFFFGALINYPDRLDIRHVFSPLKEGEGHEWFRSGLINTGSFVFHRSLLDNPDNWMPETDNPYTFAALSKFDMKMSADEPFVENPLGAFTDGVQRHGLSIGNPWGDDFFQAYLLTRHNKVKSIDVPIYIINPRGYDDLQLD